MNVKISLQELSVRKWTERCSFSDSFWRNKWWV